MLCGFAPLHCYLDQSSTETGALVQFGHANQMAFSMRPYGTFVSEDPDSLPFEGRQIIDVGKNDWAYDTAIIVTVMSCNLNNWHLNNYSFILGVIPIN